MRCIIAPSILACDLRVLGDSVRAVEFAGADWHHVDVMDGHFVPNLTFGPDIVQAVRRASTLPVDAHLMITDPARFAEIFIRAGANIVTFHIEVVPNPRPLLRKIRRLGARPGLVVKPGTPVSAVFPFLDEVDLVLVMSVEPGWTGQKFMPKALRKIRELRREGRPGAGYRGGRRRERGNARRLRAGRRQRDRRRRGGVPLRLAPGRDPAHPGHAQKELSLRSV